MRIKWSSYDLWSARIHPEFVSDEGEAGVAPRGLALLSAGIAFCYMTQLSRYIENMKMNIHPLKYCFHHRITLFLK